MSANNKKRLRQELFDFYSTNLSIHRPELEGRFACPICLGLFDQNALTNPQRLTVAHIYPGALGGSLTTLTCAACNHRMGTEFDSHVVNQARSARASADGKLIARMRFGNSTKDVGVELSLNGEIKGISVSGEHSNPAAVTELKTYMGAMTSTGATLHLSVPLGFNPKRLETGLWHSAYLMMFYEFGYEFVFSGLGEHMRKVLAEGIDPAEPFFVHSFIPSGVEVPWLVNSVSIVTMTPDIKCFAVCLPSETAEYSAHCINIPGLDPKSWSPHKAMVGQAMAKETQMQQISGNRKIRLLKRAFQKYLTGCWCGLDVDSIIRTALMDVVFELANCASAKVALPAVAKALGLELNHVTAVAKQLLNWGWLAGDLNQLDSGKVQPTEKAIAKKLHKEHS
jgi:hypothetical protein